MHTLGVRTGYSQDDVTNFAKVITGWTIVPPRQDPVHGGEFEGIVGAVNLLAVLETGKDLRGRDWPEIAGAAKWMYICDPDRNVVEFFQDLSASL